MSVNISNELYIFFVSFVCGIICSAIFSFFRTIRIRYRQSTCLVGLWDIMFWLASCVLCYGALYHAADGRLRLYEFIALGVGGFLYFLVFERVFNILFVNFFGFVEFIFKILLTPALFLYKIILYNPITGMYKFFKIIIEKVFGGKNEYSKNSKKNKHLRTNQKHKKVLQRKQHSS